MRKRTDLDGNEVMVATVRVKGLGKMQKREDDQCGLPARDHGNFNLRWVGGWMVGWLADWPTRLPANLVCLLAACKSVIVTRFGLQLVRSSQAVRAGLKFSFPKKVRASRNRAKCEQNDLAAYLGAVGLGRWYVLVGVVVVVGR